ncbi:MAG TPA: hypothetical protein VHW66_00070 [Stellaceae bacterium]|jgi:hypothetical protein|nr:hypothetical protein [Stellaceae bacterium]
MTKRQLPPVPPAGRSPDAPGEDRRRQPDDNRDPAEASAANTETGRQKNVAVNTTNQGHQQDR